MGSIALVVYTTWRSMDRKAKKAVRCSPAQGVLRGVLLLSGSGVACWCQLLMVVVASCVSETRPGTVPHARRDLGYNDISLCASKNRT